MGNKAVFNIPQDPKYLEEKFFGSMSKTLTEEVICFQQSAQNYLTYLSKNKVVFKQNTLDAKNGGDLPFIKIVLKFHKYLNRLDDVVQRRNKDAKAKKRYSNMTEDQVFVELDKVVQCQMNVEINPQQVEQMLQAPETENLVTNIPLVDIILNIDKFTAHFEDRLKIIRIVKELYKHCTSMKKLLLKHGKLIIRRLIQKYDKLCVVTMPPGQFAGKDQIQGSGTNLGQRDEFVADNVGSIMRLYTKSKSLSQVFEDFNILESIVKLMQNDQFIIQSDAHKTFDSILKGQRINEDLQRPDRFVEWIENDNPCGEMFKQSDMRATLVKQEAKTHEKLDHLLFNMRKSDVYTFKRQSMKLQYELLTYGLQTSIEFIGNEHKKNFGENDILEEGVARAYFEEQVPEKMRGQYYNFSTYFVDNKENLKDIMQQLGTISDGEERIKEELFLMLSFFILTFEFRQHRIRNMILKNKRNFVGLIDEFKESCENEECKELLMALNVKLAGLGEKII